MPRRDNLRPLRRSFNRATEFAREVGANGSPFDKHYEQVSVRTLIELATCSPSLHAQDTKSRLDAIRAAMIVLAAAEIKTQQELEDEQATS